MTDDDPDPYTDSDGCVAHDVRGSRKQRPTRTRRPVDADREVLERLAAGDLRGALRLAMDCHGAAVYRYCRAILGDAALAEDVQQQVFIEAYRDLPTFAGRSSVRTWLFAIARHRCLDAVKARTRAQARLEYDGFADAPDPRPEPGEMLDDARLRAALAACFEELDDKVRAVLLLRYQQGFTFEQIAEICGERSGTLQVRVARALPVLRARLRLRTGGRF